MSPDGKKILVRKGGKCELYTQKIVTRYKAKNDKEVKCYVNGQIGCGEPLKFIHEQPKKYKDRQAKNKEHPAQTYFNCEKVGCKKPSSISTAKGFWHCSSSNCDYDVCKVCEPEEKDGDFIEMQYKTQIGELGDPDFHREMFFFNKDLVAIETSKPHVYAIYRLEDASMLCMIDTTDLQFLDVLCNIHSQKAQFKTDEWWK